LAIGRIEFMFWTILTSFVHAQSILSFFGTRDILFSRWYPNWKPHRDVTGRERVGNETKRNKTTFLSFLFSLFVVALRWLSDAKCWHNNTLAQPFKFAYTRNSIYIYTIAVWQANTLLIFIRTNVIVGSPRFFYVAFYVTSHLNLLINCAYLFLNLKKSFIIACIYVTLDINLELHLKNHLFEIYCLGSWFVLEVILIIVSL